MYAINSKKVELYDFKIQGSTVIADHDSEGGRQAHMPTAVATGHPGVSGPAHVLCRPMSTRQTSQNVRIRASLVVPFLPQSPHDQVMTSPCYAHEAHPSHPPGLSQHDKVLGLLDLSYVNTDPK
jgi:hypothetical protein